MSVAARQPSLMTERDDDDDDRVTHPFKGTMVNLPDDDGKNNRQGAADDFQIIETDDDFKPVGNESRLTEQDHGDQTFLEQRRTDEQRQNGDANGGRGETRAQRRQRQKDGREKTLRENAFLHAEVAALTERLNGIEPRVSEFDRSRAQDQIAGVERDIQSTEAQFRSAETKLGDALTALAQGDESARENYMQALRDRDAAVMKGQQLIVRKNMLLTGNPIGDVDPNRQQHQGDQQDRQQDRGSQQRQTQQAAPMRPAVRARIQEFQAENTWFDPNSNDLDSQIARSIDAAVAAEGFDPATDDYWDELDARLREKMPYKFTDQQQERQGDQRQQTQQRQQQAAPQRRGPMVSSGGGGRSPAGNGKQVYLSPQRKEALKLAGALDQDGVTVLDKGKFSRILSGYADFDRTNGAARA